MVFDIPPLPCFNIVHESLLLYKAPKPPRIRPARHSGWGVSYAQAEYFEGMSIRGCSLLILDSGLKPLLFDMSDDVIISLEHTYLGLRYCVHMT